MVDDTINLKEVVVKADRVLLKGDTISYLVGKYATQNDRNIGDVLERIPGFELDRRSGKISYNGKEINKFYIDGMDMLGGRYGIATNSIPQIDVSTLQVLKNHQPIRVLQDFTSTDEVAININMKNSARNHWVETFNGSMGLEAKDKGLWKFEGFGLRLRPNFQSMLTYKTNNVGQDIISETNLLFADTGPVNTYPISDYITLSASNSPNLDYSRILFNKSYAITANTLKKIDINSQITVQAMYKNDEQETSGSNYVEYYINDFTRIVNNNNNNNSNSKALSVSLKYENNSNEKYLSNLLSSDLKGGDIWVVQKGTQPNLQNYHSHDYIITDNLCLLKKVQKHLISIYSKNTIQSLTNRFNTINGNDTINQNLNIHYFETNTYGTGSVKWNHIIASFTCGFDGYIRHLNKVITAASDSIVKDNNSNNKFNFFNIYLNPSVEYKIGSFKFNLACLLQNTSCIIDGNNYKPQFYCSPNFNITWTVSSRMKISTSGGTLYNLVDYNKIFSGFIFQDYQNINKGFIGNEASKTNSFRLGMSYNDALNSLSSFLFCVRSFNSDPYLPSQEFIGKYIFLSSVLQNVKGNSVNVNWELNKGINCLNALFNFHISYLLNKSKILQNNLLMPLKSRILNVVSRFDFNIWKVKINNIVSYRHNLMYMELINSKSSIENLMYKFLLSVPINRFEITLNGERYWNGIVNGRYKNTLLADIGVIYRAKRFEYSVSLTNIFNYNNYSYSFSKDLMYSSYENKIRGRQILFSLYYKI